MTTIAETQDELIEMFEDRFDCKPGERKAWFEIPQKGGETIRGIYVVYSVRGQVLADVRQYFIKEVIVPLAVKAQLNVQVEDPAKPFLYWRLAERLEVRQDGVWFTVYTRICVLDGNLESIVLPDIVKTEGGPTPICAYSAGAY